jgi:GNAT superfamily N-acetyltransferase
LLDRDKIWLFIAKKIAQKSAKYNDKNLGIITLHEYASIYASGVFDEISELYVEPEYRSLKVGGML